MIKITVEEIEIIIQAKVDEVTPTIRKMVQSVKSELSKIDLSSITDSDIGNKISSSVKSAIPKIKSAQKEIQSESEKFKIFKDGEFINKAEFQKSISGISSEFNRFKADAGTLNNILDLSNWKSQFEDLPPKIEKVKRELDNLKSSGKVSWGLPSGADSLKQFKSPDMPQSNMSFVDKFKGKLQSIPSLVEKITGSFGKINGFILSAVKTAGNLASKLKTINNPIKEMTGQFKVGLGQLIKYVGALFGLRTAYNTIRNAANAWLSSQDVAAQQATANINYMKYALGSAFAPIIQWIISLVYQLLGVIQSLVYAISSINIFAKGSADAFNKIASGAKKAKDEIKQLSGIHNEINNISDPNKDNGGSGSATPNIDLEEVDTRLSDLFKKMLENPYEFGLMIGEKINEGLSKISWDKIQNTARDIAFGITMLLNGVIDGTDWNLVGTTIAEGINTAIIFAYTIITSFNWIGIGKAVANIINGLFDRINWKMAGQTVSNAIVGIFNSINIFLKQVKWQNIGKAIADFLESIEWFTIMKSVGLAIGNAISAAIKIIANIGPIMSQLLLLGTVISALEGNYIISFTLAFASGLSIGGWINEKINEIFGDGILAESLKKVGGYIIQGIILGIGIAILGLPGLIFGIGLMIITALCDFFGISSPSKLMSVYGIFIIEGLINGIVSMIQKVVDKFQEIKTKITEKMEETKQNIHDKVEQIKQNWSDKWNTIKQSGSEIVQNIKDNISNKFDETKNNVQQKIEDIRKGIVDKFTNAKNSAVNIFDDLKTGVTNAFSNIWTSIKGTINNILSGIESMVNGGLSGLSSFINGIGNKVNSLSKYTGFSVPSVSFSSVSLPRLETGGVLYDETVFVGGEYSNASSNPEIIAPEDLLYKTQIRALNDSNFSNSDDTGLQKIVVNILGRQLIYDIAELLNLQKIIDGEALLEVD